MIILYSNNCPKCEILKEKLHDADIKYIHVTDTELMQREGIDLLPVLEIDGVRFGFATAVSWINSR